MQKYFMWIEAYAPIFLATLALRIHAWLQCFFARCVTHVSCMQWCRTSSSP